MPIHHAVELLNQDQHAIALFTRGSQFIMNNNGTGSTGHWVVDQGRVEEGMKVIVYRRRKAVNEIYTATCVNVRQIDSNRYNLGLKDIREAGITENNWKVFAKTGTNPVKYVTR